VRKSKKRDYVTVKGSASRRFSNARGGSRGRRKRKERKGAGIFGKRSYSQKKGAFSRQKKKIEEGGEGDPPEKGGKERYPGKKKRKRKAYHGEREWEKKAASGRKEELGLRSKKCFKIV